MKDEDSLFTSPSAVKTVCVIQPRWTGRRPEFLEKYLAPGVEYVNQADGGTALFAVVFSYLRTISHLPMPWDDLVLVESIPYVFNGVREFVNVVQ